MSEKRQIYSVFYCSKDEKKLAGIFSSLEKAATFANERFMFEARSKISTRIKRMEIFTPEENSMFSPWAQLPIAWISFGQLTTIRLRWGGEDAEKWDKKLLKMQKANRQK